MADQGSGALRRQSARGSRYTSATSVALAKGRSRSFAHGCSNGATRSRVNSLYPASGCSPSSQTSEVSEDFGSLPSPVAHRRGCLAVGRAVLQVRLDRVEVHGCVLLRLAEL